MVHAEELVNDAYGMGEVGKDGDTSRCKMYTQHCKQRSSFNIRFCSFNH